MLVLMVEDDQLTAAAIETHLVAQGHSAQVAENGADAISMAGQGYKFTAHVGFYPDGRPGEVFVEGEKLTSHTDVEVHDAAIVLSFALQHGASLSEIGEALLRGEGGEPGSLQGGLSSVARREFREGAGGNKGLEGSQPNSCPRSIACVGHAQPRQASREEPPKILAQP
jgi:hypothetical protein